MYPYWRKREIFQRLEIVLTLIKNFLESDFKQSRFDFTLYNSNIKRINTRIIRRTPDSSEHEVEKDNENIEFNLSSYKVDNMIMTPMVDYGKYSNNLNRKEFSEISVDLFADRVDGIYQ